MGMEAAYVRCIEGKAGLHITGPRRWMGDGDPFVVRSVLRRTRRHVTKAGSLFICAQSASLGGPGMATGHEAQWYAAVIP